MKRSSWPARISACSPTATACGWTTGVGARPGAASMPDVARPRPSYITQGLHPPVTTTPKASRCWASSRDTGKLAVTSLARHFVGATATSEPRVTMWMAGSCWAPAGRTAIGVSGRRVTMISPAGSRFNPPGRVCPPVLGRSKSPGIRYRHVRVRQHLCDPAAPSAQKFAGLDEAVTGLEVRRTIPGTRRRVGQELEGSLGIPVSGDRLAEQNASLFSALKLEKLAMGVILLLIVLVAAFNIVSTLTMVVTRQDAGDRDLEGDGAVGQSHPPGVHGAGAGDRRDRHLARARCWGS